MGLLATALLLGAINLVVTTPRLRSAALADDVELGGRGAWLLRRTVSGEVALVASTVFAAAVLTSLPPPSAALGRVGQALARVGPGPVRRVVTQSSTRATVAFLPNRAVRPMGIAVQLARGGVAVTGADVIARFERHGHGPTGVPAHGEAARKLQPAGARVADGRQLGRDLRHHPEDGPPLLAPHRRPGRRMSDGHDPRPRVAAALLALAAAGAAVLIVVLLARSVLGT